jgi:hypothetical protein
MGGGAAKGEDGAGVEDDPEVQAASAKAATATTAARRSMPLKCRFAPDPPILPAKSAPRVTDELSMRGGGMGTTGTPSTAAMLAPSHRDSASIGGPNRAFVGRTLDRDRRPVALGCYRVAILRVSQYLYQNTTRGEAHSALSGSADSSANFPSNTRRKFPFERAALSACGTDGRR